MRFVWTGNGRARHSVRVSWLIALLACWFGGAPAWASTVTEVRVDDERIVLRFDDPVTQASSFLLGGPERIAVDVAGAAPGGRADLNDGPVAAVRQGRHGEDGARIVFDLARPAIVTGGRFEDGGRRLTLSLSRVDDRRFTAAAGNGRLRFATGAKTGVQLAASRISVAVPASRGVRLPTVKGNPDRPLVVIDAGHGGHDPGAISPHGGLQEKDLTLKVAKAIRDELLESGRVRVALTRDRDEFLVLRERYNIARRLGASLFISIHCDSAENPLATGASVYTLSEIASDKEAARLAARENKADVLAGVNLGDHSADISSILIDLTQRETMNASAGFARLLGRESTGLVPLKANYHRMASLMVLKAPDMPSILFETGYLSNEGDAERLASADGRRAIAEGVRRAVEVHFARRLAAR